MLTLLVCAGNRSANFTTRAFHAVFCHIGEQIWESEELTHYSLCISCGFLCQVQFAGLCGEQIWLKISHGHIHSCLKKSIWKLDDCFEGNLLQERYFGPLVFFHQIHPDSCPKIFSNFVSNLMKKSWVENLVTRSLYNDKCFTDLTADFLV
jgi:hypothetical protein